MIKKLKVPLFASIFMLALVVPAIIVPSVTHADPSVNTTGSTDGSVNTSASTEGVGLVNPLKGISSLSGLLNAILDAIVNVLAPIFLTLAFIYVGFLFVMAQGNEEKIRSARSALVWTVVGALILLGAKAIGLVIQSTVGGL